MKVFFYFFVMQINHDFLKHLVIFFFFFSMCMYMQMSVVPTEAKRGHEIPLSWS